MEGGTHRDMTVPCLWLEPHVASGYGGRGAGNHDGVTVAVASKAGSTVDVGERRAVCADLDRVRLDPLISIIETALRGDTVNHVDCACIDGHMLIDIVGRRPRLHRVQHRPSVPRADRFIRPNGGITSGALGRVEQRRTGALPLHEPGQQRQQEPEPRTRGSHRHCRRETTQRSGR